MYDTEVSKQQCTEICDISKARIPLDAIIALQVTTDTSVVQKSSHYVLCSPVIPPSLLLSLFTLSSKHVDAPHLIMVH